MLLHLPKDILLLILEHLFPYPSARVALKQTSKLFHFVQVPPPAPLYCNWTVRHRTLVCWNCFDITRVDPRSESIPNVYHDIGWHIGKGNAYICYGCHLAFNRSPMSKTMYYYQWAAFNHSILERKNAEPPLCQTISCTYQYA
jgi:hypothetical protein